MRLSVLAALVLAGPTLAADPTPAELFPLAVGRSWTYRVFPGGPVMQDERFVIKVVGEETIRGTPCFKLEASLGDRGVVATEYVGVLADGVYRFKIEKEELSSPVPFLKSTPLKPRGATDWGSVSYQIGSRSATAKFSAQAEAVTVKAGTFKAVKVQAESKEVGDNNSRRTTVWYAPGVGIVKQMIDGRPGAFPGMTLELETHEKGTGLK
jgi:hypothetical protein